MFPDSEFPDVDKESCVANGAAQRLVCEYDQNARVRIQDLLRCSYGISYPEGVVLMVLKGKPIPTESRPLIIGVKKNKKCIHTKIYRYNGDVDRMQDIDYPVINNNECKKVQVVDIHNSHPASSGVQQFELRLAVNEDGSLELKCKDLETGEMLESFIYDAPMVVYACLLSQSDGNTAHFVNETPLSP